MAHQKGTRMRWSYGVTAIMLLQPAASAVHAGEAVQVKISDLAFSPAEITVEAGGTVEWINDDFIDHTATATSNEWDVALGAGESGSLELARPGKVQYFCRFHPNMTGVIHVVPK